MPHDFNLGLRLLFALTLLPQNFNIFDFFLQPFWRFFIRVECFEYKDFPKHLLVISLGVYCILFFEKGNASRVLINPGRDFSYLPILLEKIAQRLSSIIMLWQVFYVKAVLFLSRRLIVVRRSCACWCHRFRFVFNTRFLRWARSRLLLIRIRGWWRGRKIHSRQKRRENMPEWFWKSLHLISTPILSP